MSNSKASKKIIIIIASINVVLIAVYIILQLRIGAVEADMIKVHQSIGASQEGAQAFAFLEGSINQTKKEREKLNTHLVKQSETIAFLNSIEGLAEYSGSSVDLKSVDRAEFDDEPVLQLSVTALGTFQEVYHFLSLLETMPYKMVITDVSFQLDKGDRGGANYKEVSIPRSGNDDDFLAETKENTNLSFASTSSATASSTSTSTTKVQQQTSEVESENMITVTRPVWKAAVSFELRGFKPTKEEE